MLQWGRGRMAAEGKYRTAIYPLFIGLQWGRGRMAAEGLKWQRRGGESATSFNGAAAGWPRKAVRDTLACISPWCFNGAAAGWPRKANVRGSSSS